MKQRANIVQRLAIAISAVMLIFFNASFALAEDYTVTLGEDKVFTTYNYHHVAMIDNHDYYPPATFESDSYIYHQIESLDYSVPSIYATATSSGQTVTIQSQLENGHKSFGSLGIIFQVNSNEIELKEMTAKISFIIDYELHPCCKLDGGIIEGDIIDTETGGGLGWGSIFHMDACFFDDCSYPYPYSFKANSTHESFATLKAGNRYRLEFNMMGPDINKFTVKEIRISFGRIKEITAKRVSPPNEEPEYILLTTQPIKLTAEIESSDSYDIKSVDWTFDSFKTAAKWNCSKDGKIQYCAIILPEPGSHGEHTAKCTLTYRDKNTLEENTETKQHKFKVFFEKDKSYKDGKAGDPNGTLPNWFKYWQKDGAVRGLTSMFIMMQN